MDDNKWSNGWMRINEVMNEWMRINENKWE